MNLLIVIFSSIWPVLFLGAVQNQPATSIKGQVIVSGIGTSLSGAEIRLIAEGKLSQRVVTDQDGHFAMQNLPTGRYTIEVHLLGFADFTAIIYLKPGHV